MPHAYWRRNLNSLKRRSRSKRHKRFSASVHLLRSSRANSRAAAVRVRCLPYRGGRPLTLTLSPAGGEGISRALPLLLVAIVRLGLKFSAEPRIYFLGSVHFGQRSYLCPSVSNRYNKASQVKGALNALEDDRRAIEFRG